MNSNETPEPCVGAVIIRQDGKYLLAKSPKFHNQWIIAGGHIELGETMFDAVKREVIEELQIEIEPVEVIKVQDYIFDNGFHKKKHLIFIDILCEYLSGEPIVDGRELTEAGWFSYDELIKLDIEPYTKVAIDTHLMELPRNNHKTREPE